MRCKRYAVLNHTPWVANLARFQAVLCTQFRLLEAIIVVRQSIATVSAAIWRLFRLAAASASSMAKQSKSSILLYMTGHPVGGAFPLNLICISLKFLHTSPQETPIAHVCTHNFLVKISTNTRFACDRGGVRVWGSR